MNVDSLKRLMYVLTMLLLMALSQHSWSGVIFSDDFESGEIVKHNKNMPGWGDSVRVTISDQHVKNGKYAARFFFPGSADLKADAFSELRFELGGLYKELWFRYDLYIPKNYRHRLPDGANNNKGPIMLWSGPYQGSPQLTYIQFWRSKNPALVDASVVAPGWKTGGATSKHYFDQSNLSAHYLNARFEAVMIDPRLDAGQWVDVVVNIRAADVGQANGIVQLWKNGRQIYSTKNATNYAADPEMNGFERGYLLGWANSGFDEDTEMYIDNVIVGTAPADIGLSAELGNPPAAPKLHVN